MLFQYSDKSLNLHQRLQVFMQEQIYPNEAAFAEQLESADNRFAPLPLVEALKQKAR